MSRQVRLSSYTPSNTAPEILERIFVQRERLLTKIVERLARSMSSGDKHHILLIGPRGCGKTHLVSLAAHRLEARPELNESMRIAWLGEDDTFAALIDIALGIADALTVEYPGEFATDYRKRVHGLPPDDAAHSILRSVIADANGRNILLITENMDRTFRELGDLGCKRWRAFLQETTRIATLATAQQLFDEVSDRNEAFFGFFDIHHLEPLSVEDARLLIRKICAERHDERLLAYLDSPQGKYRVRALHHLAGGNHRIYVLLADFLTQDLLDDLVEAFERLAEDMTPYFQERIRSLAPQQAKLVHCLCNAGRALTVKEIAEETFIAEGNCSKQLGTLKAKGYVQSDKRGKESYYDMAEPLMRLCLEVKNQRGRPLRLVAKFLRAWFPTENLRNIPATNGGALSRGDHYRLAALALDQGSEAAIIEGLHSGIRKCIETGDFENAESLIAELNCADEVAGTLAGAELCLESGHNVDCAELTNLLDRTDLSINQRGAGLRYRAIGYGQRGDVENEISDYSALINLTQADPSVKAQALFNRALAWGKLGSLEQEIADYTEVLEMQEDDSRWKARALVNRGSVYYVRGQAEQAYKDWTALIESSDAPSNEKSMALTNRGQLSSEMGNDEQALADYTLAAKIEDAPEERRAEAFFNRGHLLSQMGDFARAIADFTAVVESGADRAMVVRALVNRSVIYGQSGDFARALADCTAVIEMANPPPDGLALALNSRGSTRARNGEFALALLDFAAVIELPTAPSYLKAEALLNRGLHSWTSGATDDALADFGAVASMSGIYADQTARALIYQSDLLLRSGKSSGHELVAQEYLVSAIELPQVSPALRDRAYFMLPRTLVAHAQPHSVAVALENAFAKADPSSAAYGGDPVDLLSRVLERGHRQWHEFVMALAPIYLRHGAGAMLSQAITRTIEELDSAGYSASQLDLWNAAWQEVGKDTAELELSLRCLSAAIEVVKSKNDRPLFRLPPEIRELVRPLLSTSLD